MRKYPANIYLFKVNKRNIRKKGVEFEHNSHPFSSVSIADFEQINVSWYYNNLYLANISNSCTRYFYNPVSGQFYSPQKRLKVVKKYFTSAYFNSFLRQMEDSL